MKKILLSAAAIVAAITLSISATMAYFSDTESSVGNTLTAGTINIAVDGQDKWQREAPFDLVDLKPGQNVYTNFTVKNVGTNPVNIFKEVKNASSTENGINDPECEAYGGQWDGQNCQGGTPKNDLENMVDYDLSVKLYDEQNVLRWYQTLYHQNKTISQLNQPMFLGMIPANWEMKVVESYHLQASAGNEYQSDKMTFDIVLTGEQLRGELTLAAKSGDPDWIVQAENYAGTLSYEVRADQFKYSFSGVAPLPNTKYWLINYVDPFGTPGITFGSAVSDGSGNITISGSADLNQDLLNAKIWLVTDADYDESANKLTGWNPANYLFETGLIDYYDSSI